MSELNELERQRATYGIDAPPRLSIRIEDINKEIEEKEKKIRDIRAELASLHKHS